MKITVEISAEEILKFADHIENDIANRVIKDLPKTLWYPGKTQAIEIGDEIEILPSENCVTNADTIKYDERIDGKKGTVLFINAFINQITIGLDKGKVLVHPTWLKYIGK